MRLGIINPVGTGGMPPAHASWVGLRTEREGGREGGESVCVREGGREDGGRVGERENLQHISYTR